MRYEVVHTTSYHYGLPATTCYSLAHLSPRDTTTQQVLSSDLVIDPAPDDLSSSTDLYGNRRTYFTVERPHDVLAVTSSSAFEITPVDLPVSAFEPWERSRDAIAAASPDREFVLDSPHVPKMVDLATYAHASFPAGASLYDSIADLTHRINVDFEFLPGSTTVSTPISTVLQQRSGVCQDFAHVAVGCLRAMGLAARYVSGYIETLPPPGMPKLVGADATHAWCSVRAADGAWIDMDPTNDVIAPWSHLTVAWGRDYGDVVPLRGVVTSKGAEAELVVEVDVVRTDG